MAGKDAYGVELGNLKIVNSTNDIGTTNEVDFTFTMPSGGVNEMRELTYHILRGTAAVPVALANAAEGGNFFTSEQCIIKKFEVFKAGSSQKVNLLTGTPNIKEVAGDGKLARLLTVIETLENNEQVVITIHNNDTAQPLHVSFTIWVATFPRARRIAAQGSDSVPE